MEPAKTPGLKAVSASRSLFFCFQSAMSAKLEPLSSSRPDLG